MIFKRVLSAYNVWFIVLLLAFACKNRSSQISLTAIAIAPPILTIEQARLKLPVDTPNTIFNGLKKKSLVLRYYKEFGFEPVWINGENQNKIADTLISIISNSLYYGLPSERYHSAELAILKEKSQDVLLRKEVLLTDAFFCLSTDLNVGVQKSMQESAIDSSQIYLLRRAVADSSVVKTLESQEPTFAGYIGLKHGLKLILDSMKVSEIDSSSTKDVIRLIAINLERWRADSINFGNRYIFVNIPSYMLEVAQNDSVALSSKVIVGTPKTETPLFSSVVECFSIYPYWHVPRKISVEEYLPVIKNDTSFIRRNNFDVLDRKGNILNPDSVQWGKFHANYFPVVLRQREGTENALGVIKFIFDNPYAVFLHDTNAKRLFRNEDRAFSHGCIRMEKAVDLAHYLITGVVGSESKMINKYLKGKKRHWIDLKNPIPIYIRYFTCEFRDNTLFTYKDIYSKDRMLYELLFQDFYTFSL